MIFDQLTKYNLYKKAKYSRYLPYGLLQPNKALDGAWKTISIDFIGPLPVSPNLDNIQY